MFFTLGIFSMYNKNYWGWTTDEFIVFLSPFSNNIYTVFVFDDSSSGMVTLTKYPLVLLGKSLEELWLVKVPIYFELYFIVIFFSWHSPKIW